MWPIVQVQSTPKMKQNSHDWLYKVQSMMKMRQDNDVTDYTCAVYAKNDTKLLKLIW